MTNKCLGCGVKLQNVNKEELGYVQKLDESKNKLCERCFRIQNYNEYQVVIKDNEEFLNILKDINETKDLTLLLIDIFNMPTNLELIKKYLSNDIIVVLTKYDLLKPYIKEEKLLNYINEFDIPNKRTIIISSNKNYNMDLLMEVINKYKNSKNVYVVGNTNAGKSTLINKIIFNYSDKFNVITTSISPTTTLSSIAIDINDNLTIVDTPGILESNNIIDLVDYKSLSKIVPKMVIKPRTFQIKVEQVINFGKFAQIYIADKNDITVYLSNEILIERVFKKSVDENLIKHILHVLPNHDVVIKGLGFVKVIKETTLEVYTLPNVDVYSRKSLI